ncbi:AI-2E family transporter [Clostridium sp. DJ247]|uniref:AI-2E family transporter n=1 Tax=Clostridium sp. DJ247 TaxID=2726188 RepID=UPI0016246C72|nr:AI-2E family transporter [Clostridium sp. DJ247]MBC2581989.1 AI-2E family transporter [Clostridium sp. DJ247]
MNLLKEFFAKESTKRFLAFIIILLLFYAAKSLLNLFLLTFLFTYIMNSLQNFIVDKIKICTPFKEKIITIILYSFLFATIVLLLFKYVPELVNQSKFIVNQAMDYDFSFESNSNFVHNYIISIFQQIDFKSYIKSGFIITFQLASNIGKWSINVFIAILLSLFFMLEKEKVMLFLSKFKNSKISGLYKYISFFGNNFLNSFGKVIQAQIMIAFINTILSVIMLYILHFPQLITLGFMIFVLSLVPVAGVVISLVPLCLIALKIGGLVKVLYVLIMIAVIHSIESYILNPKLMSAKVDIPIFFTFVILIASEHFIGIWGLLIGIPLFMFVLDLLDVKLH